MVRGRVDNFWILCNGLSDGLIIIVCEEVDIVGCGVIVGKEYRDVLRVGYGCLRVDE